jgi:NADPH:quinone reductase-like Zn-dependent oxidoreductase
VPNNKNVRYNQTGAVDVLKLENMPLSEPDKGEVRLKVEAFGLNRAEVMFRQGQYLEDAVFMVNINIPDNYTEILIN